MEDFVISKQMALSVFFVLVVELALVVSVDAHFIGQEWVYGYYPATTGADVFCTLGPTIKKTETREGFRRVDYDYPLTRLGKCRPPTPNPAEGKKNTQLSAGPEKVIYNLTSKLYIFMVVISIMLYFFKLYLLVRFILFLAFVILVITPLAVSRAFFDTTAMSRSM